MLEDLLGKKAQVIHLPFHPADMFANQANVEKARRLLGWEPQFSLGQGVANLVAWYNAEREWTSQVITD
jgi:nucleoside-diphosphate-sugar epimerase